MLPTAVTTTAAALLGGTKLPYAATLPARLDNITDELTIYGHPLRPPSPGRLYVPGVHLELTITPLTAIAARLLPGRQLHHLDQYAPAGRAQAFADAQLAATHALRQATVAAARTLGLPSSLGGHGIQIDQIADGPARGRLQPDDLITAISNPKIGHQPVGTREQLTNHLQQLTPGDTTELTIHRNGHIHTINMPIWATTDGQPELGIYARTLNEHVLGPLHTTLDTTDAGGPSAGLALALTILDQCHPDNEPTINTDVVVTGTLDTHGHVGPVAGIPNKVAAAAAANIRHMIIPTTNLEHLPNQLPPGLTIHPTDTLHNTWHHLTTHNPPDNI